MNRPPAAPSLRILARPGHLEDHLPPDWWRTLFTTTYLRTDGDVIENEANTRQDVDLLTALLPLDPAQAILDLCCGQGRHCLELARRGFARLTGLDHSACLLALARERATRAGFAIRFVEGDVRRPLLPAGTFAVVISMGNSFGYFADERDDRLVLQQVHQLLAPQGCLFLDLSDGAALRASFAPQSSEWLDPRTLVRRERTLSRSGRRLISREVLYHLDDGLLADQVYAETLYSDSDLTAMLAEAGFAHVRVQRENPVLSTRNEDLGMLAHRMLITATKD